MSLTMPPAKNLRTVCFALALAAAAASCGQRGPLTLPESARPVERLDPAATAPTDTPEDEDERSESDSGRE